MMAPVLTSLPDKGGAPGDSGTELLPQNSARGRLIFRRMQRIWGTLGPIVLAYVDGRQQTERASLKSMIFFEMPAI